MVVIVVFCRDAFSRAVDEPFLNQANLFIVKTTHLLEAAKVFAA